MHHDKKTWADNPTALYTLDFLFLLWETFSVLLTFGLRPLVMQVLQTSRTMKILIFFFKFQKFIVGSST